MKFRQLLTSILLLCLVSISFSQLVIIDSLLLPSSNYEYYWLQIPQDYSPLDPPPLLIGAHQYGGNCYEFVGTGFTTSANQRGWMALAITGVPEGYNGYTHWWSKRVQEQLDLVMDTVFRAFPFNLDRIFIVGGSMGGAAGMQYHHNHLDPNGYMIAATAGGSGIIDLARRAREQGINYSMRVEFGPLDSLPEINFQYKRNSAVVFWDTTNSLHYNLTWLPTLMKAGELEPHYIHAVDLEQLYGNQMRNYEVYPTPGGNHGWINLHPDSTCDWLASQPSIKRYPTIQNISVDEPRRCYDIEVVSMRSDTNMARVVMTADSFWIHGQYDLRNHRITYIRNALVVKLHIRNDMPVYNVTVRNRDTASVTLQISIPHSVGSPSITTIYPFLNSNFNISNRQLTVTNIPPNYSGQIQLHFPQSEVSSIYSDFVSSIQLYPNPMNHTTTLQFLIKESSVIQLSLYDALGRKVESIPTQRYEVGSHNLKINLSHVSSGTYFLVGRLNQKILKKQITLIK